MRNTDGPPLTFVAIGGVFAFTMFYVHTQLVAQGVKIAMPFQYEDPDRPAMMATLDGWKRRASPSSGSRNR